MENNTQINGKEFTLKKCLSTTNENVVMLDNRVLHNANLSLGAKGIYGYLLSVGGSNFDIKQLAEDNRISVQKAKKLIAELRRAKVIADQDSQLDSIDFKQLASAENMRANYLPLSQENVVAFGTFGAVLLAYLKDLEAFTIQGRDYHSQFVKSNFLDEYWDKQPNGFPISCHNIARQLDLDECEVEEWIEVFINEGILVLLPPKGNNNADHYAINTAQIIKSRYIRGVTQ